MKIEDVILLAKAGFTSEQIAKMYCDDKINADSTVTPAVDTGSPEKDPAGTQDPAPSAPQAAATAVPNASSAGSETEGALLKEIKELRLAIQAGAIRQGSGKGPEQQTVEEVLASIIEP